MANNFSTLKGAAATEKFNLVRLEPARSVEGSLSLSSGTTYTMTFAFNPVSKVEVNGTAYTLVSGTPSSGEYSYTESTRLLTINLGAALTTQVVVVYYYLFYSADKDRKTYQNPLDSNTSERRWQPRISRNPAFDINLTNIIDGRLSFSASSLELHNEDNDFQQYLTANDSFFRKQITIWLCLDNTENVSLAYRGYINRLTVGEKVSIEYFDELSKLSDIFYSNSNILSSTYNTTDFSNLFPNHEGRPIRKLYSQISKYEVIANTVGSSNLYKVHPENLLEASCVNYSATISTSTNREWGTVLSVGDGGLQTDTVQGTDHTNTDYSIITNTSGKLFKIGDTLLINTHYVQVLQVDSATQFKCTKNAAIATSDTITRPGISTIVIQQGASYYYPLFSRDYTVAYSSQTNDIVKVTFTNNFEANHSGMATLDPGNSTVRFRAWSDTAGDYDHGDVVSSILTDAGLSVNSASITAANSALTATTNFYNPPIDSDSFESYQSVLEKLLSSTFGFLSLNNDLEIEYHVFDTLSPSNSITDREILLRTMRMKVDYNDIITSLKPENPHDIIEVNYTNASIEDTRSQYLHGVKVTRPYFHYLSNTNRMQKILDVLSERRAVYMFDLKTEPDAIIGDEFTLSRNYLLGNETSDSVITIGTTKTATGVTLMTTDLLGI